jgi:hypothetical protein
MENILDWLLSHENVSIAKTGVVSEKNNNWKIISFSLEGIPNKNTY